MDQLMGGRYIQHQKSQVSGNRKSQEGWPEMGFSVDKPQCMSPIVKRIPLSTSKMKASEMRYSVQISSESKDSTHKNDGKTKGDEKGGREKNRPDECHFDYLTPIEKEAKQRHERRMKQKQDREKNKEDIFFF